MSSLEKYPPFPKNRADIKYIKFEILQIMSPSEDVKFSNVRGLYLRKYGILTIYFRTTWPRVIGMDCNACLMPLTCWTRSKQQCWVCRTLTRKKFVKSTLVVYICSSFWLLNHVIYTSQAKKKLIVPTLPKLSKFEKWQPHTIITQN